MIAIVADYDKRKGGAIMAQMLDNADVDMAGVRVYECLFSIWVKKGYIDSMDTLCSIAKVPIGIMNRGILSLKREGYLEQASDSICSQFKKYGDDTLILKKGFSFKEDNEELF